MTKLEGSEKQVAWAENLRDSFTKGAEKMLAWEVKDAAADGQDTSEGIQMMRDCIEAIASIKSASWFIDHREQAKAASFPTFNWYSMSKALIAAKKSNI